MAIEISLQQKQKEAIELSKETPIVFYGGAKGGGKSYVIRAREVLRRLKYPKSKGLIIRKTYPELLSNHIQAFYQEYPDTIQYFRGGKAIYWPNGSITEFSYLGNTNDVYTYQGRAYDDISIDEVTQHDEEVFQILSSSSRLSNPTNQTGIKPRIFLTGNPGGKGHAWVKRLFIDRQFNPNERPENYAFLQAFLTDNRALSENDPDYTHRLDALPENIRRAYKDGDWDVFTGQYFPEFNRNIHVCESFNPKKSYVKYGGMDWGYAAPFAMLGAFVQSVKHEGVVFNRLWIYKEITGKQKYAEEWAKVIDDQLNLNEYNSIYADPAMFNTGTDGGAAISNSFKDVWKNNGYKLKKANNDRLAGWDLIRKWLTIAPDGLPYMIISDNCRELIRTFPQVIYDEKDLEDLDTSGEDHQLDALRYLIMHLRWINGKVGGFKHKTSVNNEINTPKFFANVQDGKELPIKIDKFK